MKEQVLVLGRERHSDAVAFRAFKVQSVRVILLATLDALENSAFVGPLQLSDQLIHFVLARFF